ncbi:Spore coat associated protein JA (CotJA) [Ruminococcus sp. YE71]|uniref:spore coat associated protein CotJA n=1 Tax=unclassified Ruminococcus TaxID=2608920 RepID=UPI00088E4129|nr:MULTISPECIES: spore coat associated protein CotJA [unclassified Ruminococcus]SDA29434.1 Spore coat associated protein JA (CotJA) [Ruminococcus sp. YE78]SFW48281.1 Spore coat associated protein JA (CotJA) [Ruminococcus sp. YE71]
MEDLTTVFFGKADSADASACPATMSRLPAEMPVAMAYVPVQFWEKPYDCATAHARGTIFPSLDKPFIGEEAVTNGR